MCVPVLFGIVAWVNQENANIKLFYWTFANVEKYWPWICERGIKISEVHGHWNKMSDHVQYFEYIVLCVHSVETDHFMCLLWAKIIIQLLLLAHSMSIFLLHCLLAQFLVFYAVWCGWSCQYFFLLCILLETFQERYLSLL